jgi:hypothetical protein
MEGFFVVDQFEGRVELCQQVLVCGSVLVDSRESLLQQKLLFALEVHLGEVDEAFQLKADGATVGSVKEHDAQFIQGIHEDSVLIVDGCDANDALVTPRQQRHIYLRNQGQV